MKLLIQERILLFGLVPQRHNYETLKQLEETKKQLEFSEEEMRKYDISHKEMTDGRMEVKFNLEVAEGYEKEVKIKPLAMSAISKVLEDMNRNEALSEQLMSLYEKFVE